MDFWGYLTPVALIFALAAMSQLAGINKEIEKLKAEIEDLKKRL
jgi:hypothetical protein